MNITSRCAWSIRCQLINSARRVFSASKCASRPEGVMRARARVKRTPDPLKDGNCNTCYAYCTGELYDLDEVKKYFIKDNVKYSLGYLPADAADVLHVSHVKEDTVGEIFLFRRLGTFVCWNLPMEEMAILNQVLTEFATGDYPLAVVEEEKEQLQYFMTEEESSLVEGDIYLNGTISEEKKVLEKLAFSNAMALSVKLGMWEISLEKFSDTLKHLPMLFKTGRTEIVSNKEVLKKIGELLTIRHQINLYSDLLMTPDFYWDREDLELLYSKTCTYLEISKRTVVMNQKLNHCSEVIEMLHSHLSNQYSHRLEWMIIILISVEVLFEIIHLVERYS